MLLNEIEDKFVDLGLKKYKALQVFRWLAAGAESFSEMSDIAKETRAMLESQYIILKAEPVEQHKSADGTFKYLLRFSDGNCVESVLMKYKYGFALCISTQVGCRMRCRFCANSKGTFVRNLTPSEMLSQVQSVQKILGIRVSNITLMGIGEPFDNYQNVLKFLKIVCSDKGFAIGMRHVSVSTCGLPEKIRLFAKERLGVTLSVSLHAVEDEIRNKIMPINNKIGLDKLIDSCKYYTSRTGRRVSFEYAMVDGVNDSERDSERLARLMRGIISHVNLIPINNTGSEFRPSSKEKIERFAKILLSSGVKVTVRRVLGADINASCGQLRVTSLNK
ncbi:MAG: 23S rRNA (adenine(2503)-C(2))-methyltransferase RlmN [Oscillospiraceae bacterium]|nr:23S rRNA (adenine(2503)-C(2))-methyltransferase RlmN [Oscillospiraceae bacterium]